MSFKSRDLRFYLGEVIAVEKALYKELFLPKSTVYMELVLCNQYCIPCCLPFTP